MIIESKYRPAWWLKNTHLQTIWSSQYRNIVKPKTSHQRIELADGDFIDIEWLEPQLSALNTPILLLLHGLEGSIDSSYIQGLLKVSQTEPWNTVVMHFRGCGKETNRLPRSYHSGETEDLQEVLETIKSAHPDSKIMVAGFSLGGNVLLKYLGEKKDASLINYAAAISVPFLLGEASKRLDHGFSKFYRDRLLAELKQKFIRNFETYSKKLKLSKQLLTEINTFYDFDDKITAPLHDFTGADDYYQRCSSRQYLIDIKTPTLILHSADDPFMTKEVIPTEQELSESVTLELSAKGGHVGFVSGFLPWQAKYYIDERIPSWFKGQLKNNE
ncbi:MAG: putative alpha/beta-fold hydrolase [Enterobacterales bacterium]|jgi:predicted alpha/beta-fold hydrolase